MQSKSDSQVRIRLMSFLSALRLKLANMIVVSTISKYTGQS